MNHHTDRDISNRKRKYACYERFLKDTPAKSMSKRPKYINCIGIFRGSRGDTVWIKIYLRHANIYKGKHYPAGHSLEIKLGNLLSFSWAQLEELQSKYQSKADKGDMLEELDIPSFHEYAMAWLAIAKQRLVHKGYINTKGILQTSIIPFFGGYPIDQITPMLINKWQSQELQKVSSATVKRREVVLASILNSALKDQLIQSSPTQISNNIKVKDTAPRYLTPEELKSLLDKAPNVREWLADYILWGIYSGLRKGETMKLTWDNLHHIENKSFHLQFETGKTNKIRRVSCSTEMLSILEKQRERLSNSSSQLIFPYSESTLRRAWNQLRALTKITDIQIQNLRTTSATYGAISGVPLRTLAGRLGHSNTKMLEKHYAAIVGSDEELASTKISQKINDLLK